MDSRARLLTAIFNQGFRTPDWQHNEPPPIVSLEEFFEDNPSPGSIAPNLDDHPGLEFFYDRLKAIRARDDVREVVVNVYDLTDIILNAEDGWPYSENTHILTSAPESLVQAWADDLRSDGAIEGWPYGKPAFAAVAEGGFNWWSLSWD